MSDAISGSQWKRSRVFERRPNAASQISALSIVSRRRSSRMCCAMSVAAWSGLNDGRLGGRPGERAKAHRRNAALAFFIGRWHRRLEVREDAAMLVEDVPSAVQERLGAD